MGIFDIFKKKKIEEVKIQEFSFNEIVQKMDKELSKSEKEIDEIKNKMKSNLESFISELNSHVNILKSVNIDHRKEEERIKLIVKENLYFYTSYLEKLIIKLEKISFNLTTQEYLLEIQTIMNNFSKDSFKSFEKATILIGKEMGNVKHSISEFTGNFLGLIAENSSIFEKIRKINSFKSLQKELRDTKLIKSNIESSISSLEESKKNLAISKEAAEKELEVFLKSPEYKKLDHERENIDSELRELNREISKIKDKINIKELLKHYHSDEKKSIFLKKYQENFITSLETDKEFHLAKLTKEANGLETEPELRNISHKLDELTERARRNTAESRRISFESKVNNLKMDIANTEDKILDEKKKIERFSEKESQITSNLKDIAESILGKFELKN